MTYENVKFRFEPELGLQNVPVGSFCVHQVGLYNDEIIKETHKMLYHWGNPTDLWGHKEINQISGNLRQSDNFIVVEDEVFQFFDCFPFAPVHNLDDTYNLLYSYLTSGLKCKLLVMENNNFYYNQTLDSLKRYFDIEYFYIKEHTNYLFRKFNCIKQYHSIKGEALQFIKEKYLKKIVDKYEGRKYYNNICIIKRLEPKNCSTWDVIEYTENFINYKKENEIFDLNDVTDDLDYKIYLINKSNTIITNYESPFNVNVQKHCIDTNKRIILFRGYNTQSRPLDELFKKVGDTYQYNDNRGFSELYFSNIELYDYVSSIDVLINKISL